MVYDSRSIIYCDGEWHCPFSREWVEKMKRAVSHCLLHKVMDVDYYQTLDCLSEPQDARGLPMSYVIDEERRYNRNILYKGRFESAYGNKVAREGETTRILI